MRLVVSLALMFATAPAMAGPAEPAAAVVQPAAPSLDDLFLSLRKERDPDRAERIAGDIATRWAQSGSASIDLMMGWAGDAMREGRLDVALDFLDQVTVLAPTFAEGWNRRATAHVQADDPAKAMADIEKVLELEPRHFGALSGLATILAARGRDARALEAWERVLSIYPANRAAQDAVAALSETLTGDRI